MRQNIYPDPHGIETWDTTQTSRVFVHLVDSMTWREITGEEPPRTPVTAKEYARHGLPWFDLYDESLGALSGTSKLGDVKTVKAVDADKAKLAQQDDSSIIVGPVKKLITAVAGELGVRDGRW